MKGQNNEEDLRRKYEEEIFSKPDYRLQRKQKRRFSVNIKPPSFAEHEKTNAEIPKSKLSVICSVLEYLFMAAGIAVGAICILILIIGMCKGIEGFLTSLIIVLCLLQILWPAFLLFVIPYNIRKARKEDRKCINELNYDD